jgi:hypothetical protein
MKLFARPVVEQILRPETAIAAAAAGNPLVDNFVNYTSSADRINALRIPTISRARDLIVGMVSCLEIKQYARQWNGEDYERIELPPDTWFMQPDPNVTRNFFLSNLTDDLDVLRAGLPRNYTTQ